MGVDGSLSRVTRFDSSERRNDLPDARHTTPRLYLLEFCGLGEIKRRWYASSVWVRGPQR